MKTCGPYVDGLEDDELAMMLKRIREGTIETLREVLAKAFEEGRYDANYLSE